MTENVVVFKLTSGDEIISKVVEIDKENISITLKSPMKVERNITMDSNIFYTIRAWMIQQFENTNEEPIMNLCADHIIAEFIPGPEVIDQYNKTVDYFMEGDEFSYQNLHEADSDENPDNLIKANFSAPKKLQ